MILLADGPNITDWLTAGGTVLAFVVALAALALTLWQMRKQSRKDQAHQAEKFSMWCTYSQGAVGASVLYINRSTSTMHDVHATVFIDGKEVASEDGQSYGPTGETSGRAVTLSRDVNTAIDEKNLGKDNLNARMTITVGFTDAQHITWTKDAAGELTRTGTSRSAPVDRLERTHRRAANSN